MLKQRTQSTALVPVDDVVDNLCDAITASSLRSRESWPQRNGRRCESWNDESRITVHTAAEVIVAS